MTTMMRGERGRGDIGVGAGDETMIGKDGITGHAGMMRGEGVGVARESTGGTVTTTSEMGIVQDVTGAGEIVVEALRDPGGNTVEGVGVQAAIAGVMRSAVAIGTK